MKPTLERVRPHERGKSTWREVPGVVLQSEVGSDGESYRPIVKYRYEVDGATYHGDVVVKGLVGVNWKVLAARWVKRFPVGAIVPVFVDSQDPRKSVLQRGWDPILSIGLIFAGAIIGIFAYVLIGRAA